MKQVYSSSRSGKQQGTALTECAIALIVFVVLITWSIGLSNALNQLFWYSNTSYQGAYAAAETDEAHREQRTKELMDLIEWVHLKEESRARGMELHTDRTVVSHDGTGTAPQKNSVVATLVGKTKKIFGVDPSIQVSFQAPLLMSGGILTDLDVPKGAGPGGAPGRYDCCGNPTSLEQLTPCVQVVSGKAMYQCQNSKASAYISR